MKSPRIVLVEDNADQREALHTLLAAAGLQIWSVGSVEAFYKLATVQQFDLAIVDLGLPGESGLELITYLRRHLNLIIFVLTARASVQDRLIVAELKVEHYLIKPALPDDLCLLINAEWQKKMAANSELVASSWQLLVAGKKLLTPCQAVVHLTSSEVLILSCLIQQGGPVSKKQIILELGSNPDQYDLHRLDVHLSRLRAKVKKLTKTPLEIMALPGQRLHLLTEVCLM